MYVHDLETLDPADVDLLGGKGAGLARMHRLGLPVPPAFVLDTQACRAYRKGNGELPDGLVEEVAAAVERLAALTGKDFAADGDGLPLLLAVRSGAKVSMPGMMDTVLNLGLDSRTVLRVAAASGDVAFAVDTWMRFWAMFADIVLDVDSEPLKATVAAQLRAAVGDLTPRTAAALEGAVVAALEAEGVRAPTDPREQLAAAVAAVFSSWTRAGRGRTGPTTRSRTTSGRPSWSRPWSSATCAGSPAAGSPSRATRRRGRTGCSGSSSPAARGGGRRRNQDAGQPRRPAAGVGGGHGRAHAAGAPARAGVRRRARHRVHRGGSTLYLLQVRAAKRTAVAAVRTACDLVTEGLIPPATALRRVTADQVRKLVAPEFDPAAMAAARAGGKLVVTGIGASPGHGRGEAVLDADRAAQWAAQGRDVVLVRPTTSPQDLPGMLAAQAVVTARGGATSHAAVVSRALDKPCVVGCAELDVRPDEGTFAVCGRTYPEGTFLSVDGATGAVFAAAIPRVVPDQNLLTLGQLLAWADEASGAEVQAPGVVGLTDLMLAAGSLDTLLDVLGALSVDPAAAVAGRVGDAVRSALEPFLRSATGRPVALRLPVLTSARARRTVDDWASLAPELLRPLGSAALVDAYLAAVAAAAAESGHAGVTFSSAPSPGAGELEAFCRRAAAYGLAAGAVLQNVAVLARPAELAATGADLGVDLHELNRAARGSRTSCSSPRTRPTSPPWSRTC